MSISNHVQLATPPELGVCLYSPDCVKILNADGHVQFFNDEGLRLMEFESFSKVANRYWPSLWPAAHRHLAEGALAAARETGAASFMAECPTAAGTPKWWDVTVATMPGGSPQFVVISRDITDDRIAKATERSAFDRLRRITGAVADVLWDIDLATDKIWWSEGMTSTFGYGLEEVGESTQWRHEHIHPDDRQGVAGSMSAAIAEGASTWEREFRYLSARGDYVDVHDRGAIIRGPSGEALRFVGVMQDVTVRNAAASLHQLVAGELAHRVNNTLAVVMGLFQQTLRGASDIADIGTAFGGRLVAMANANTAVLRHAGDGADLLPLAQTQLAPFISAGRLAIQGPSVILPTHIAQPMALALNELATNALKYGALSTAEGVIAVTWEMSEGETGSQLELRWTESGGPPVARPTRNGLGSRLVEQGIRSATVERRFAPEGFSCAIRIPL